MFRVSNSVYLRDKRLNDEYYDIKYNQVNRIDLRKCADFTNETPEQITDNNFTLRQCSISKHIFIIIKRKCISIVANSERYAKSRSIYLPIFTPEMCLS